MKKLLKMSSVEVPFPDVAIESWAQNLKKN